LPPNDHYKGCELIFPDTVFFEKVKDEKGKVTARAKVIVKMDKKDFCLQAVKNPVKLNLASIYKDFSETVKNRKPPHGSSIFQ